MDTNEKLKILILILVVILITVLVIKINSTVVKNQPQTKNEDIPEVLEREQIETIDRSLERPQDRKAKLIEQIKAEQDTEKESEEVKETKKEEESEKEPEEAPEEKQKESEKQESEKREPEKKEPEKKEQKRQPIARASRQNKTDKVYMGEFTVTAYCHCEHCCGKSDGITASGAKVAEGTTIATDWSVLPKGTHVIIEGVGERVAQDVGGAIKGNKIDLYISSHQRAKKFGRKKLKVWIKK